MSIAEERIDADPWLVQSREERRDEWRLFGMWSLSTSLYHGSARKTIDVDRDDYVCFRG
jgi:hypothetical protein